MMLTRPAANVFERAVWIRELAVVGGLSAAFLSLLGLVARSAPTAFDRRWMPELQAIPWGELAFVPRLGSDLGGGWIGLIVAPALVVATFAGLLRWRLFLLLGAIFVLHF